MNYEQFITDAKTFAILTRNENYKERLLEAYNYLKEEKVESMDDFLSRQGLKVGAFTYTEITIFDRIKDENYAATLARAYSTLTGVTQTYIADPTIGDQLASWGTLGSTPYRDKMIADGVIMHGLTDEEKERHGWK